MSPFGTFRTWEAGLTCRLMGVKQTFVSEGWTTAFDPTKT